MEICSYIAYKEAMVASQKAQLKAKEEDHKIRLARTDEQEKHARTLAANVAPASNLRKWRSGSR
jgi:hypothetical protein